MAMNMSVDIPKLVTEAIARVRAQASQESQLSTLVEALLTIPGAHKVSELVVRCREYEIVVGRGRRLGNMEEALASLEPLRLKSAPRVVFREPVHAADGDCVLVVQYASCVGEDLVPGNEAREPFHEGACRTFRAEMQALADAGKLHPYARGIMHWLVSSESGTILLERCEVVRDGPDSERRELLESIDEIIADRRQAVPRTMAGNAIAEVFGARRVLLPVVHPTSLRTAKASIQTAINAGCKGIFLINQGMTSDQVLELTMVVRREHPTLWVGLNLLGTRPSQILRRGLEALDGRLDGIWTDTAGVDSAPEHLEDAEEFLSARREFNWNGLYFGGVAFKYQPEVSSDRLGAVSAAASRYMDVVCTSGPGTGKAADVQKVAAMRAAVGETSAIALASGVDSDNVANYLPLVDAFLVGTSIEHEFGVLDPERVDVLQARIKHSRWA